MNNDTLEHFGVKGMRWGHRKSGTKSSVGSKLKKAAIYGGAAALTGLAAYGTYKGLKGRSNYSSAVTKIVSQRKSKSKPKIKPDMDYAESILKNAWTKQRPKSSAANYGDKLKDISKNLSKSQQKVKKQGDAINKANEDALNLLKNLMK